MEKRVHMIVSGLVQGVGFRMFIEMGARELGLCGWVRNRTDGTVEIDAEGREEALLELFNLAKKGPAHSRVTLIRQEEKRVERNFKDFTVIM